MGVCVFCFARTTTKSTTDIKLSLSIESKITPCFTCKIAVNFTQILFEIAYRIVVNFYHNFHTILHQISIKFTRSRKVYRNFARNLVQKCVNFTRFSYEIVCENHVNFTRFSHEITCEILANFTQFFVRKLCKVYHNFSRNLVRKTRKVCTIFPQYFVRKSCKLYATHNHNNTSSLLMVHARLIKTNRRSHNFTDC